MIKLLREIEFHFLLAFVIRIVFTLFGLYHDSKVSQITFSGDFTSETNVVPKYTDIDYQVFSDAAIYVYHVMLKTYSNTMVYFRPKNHMNII